MNAPARFPKTARVRSRAQYSRVFDSARRIHHPLLSLHAARCVDGSPPRLGLAVSRKVDRRAVGRNRIKRVLRETFRLMQGRLIAGDYVIVAKPAAAQADNAVLAAALVEVLKRAGALPATHAVGTMRIDPLMTDPGRPRGRPDPSLPA